MSEGPRYCQSTDRLGRRLAGKCYPRGPLFLPAALIYPRQKPARLAVNPPRQLKVKKNRGDSRGGRGDIADQLILGKRRGAKARKNLPVQIGYFDFQ